MYGAMNLVAARTTEEVLWFQQDYPPPGMLEEWGVQGILGLFSEIHPSTPYLSLGVPIVNTSSAIQTAPVSNVYNDHEEIGRRAGNHLLQTGVANFAFLGLTGRHFSKIREHGFAAALDGRTYRKMVLPVKMWDWLDQMWDWIQTLPRPCGIFCSGDSEARVLLSVCRIHNVQVPGELIILGANNEEEVCRSCRPTLTSIPNHAYRIGAEAMQLLLDRMANPDHHANDIIIPPGDVVQRGSTDIRLTSDPELERILAFIRRHIHEGIDVNDLMTEFKGSRRTLENHFQKKLGHTPLAEIHQVRADLIRQLLRDTTLPLNEIAERTGIGTINHLCSFFKKQTGLTPGAFRDQMT